MLKRERETRSEEYKLIWFIIFIFEGIQVQSKLYTHECSDKVATIVSCIYDMDLHFGILKRFLALKKKKYAILELI